MTVAAGRVPSCALCGSRGARKVSDHLRGAMAGEFRARPHRCRSCGLVFLHPLMPEDEERAFYRSRFRELYHGRAYDLRRFHAGRRPDALRRRDALAALGLLEGDLLEVGSSTGAFLSLAEDRAASVTGVEPDHRQRAFAERRGLRMFSSVEEAAGAGRTYDTVALFHVLEHVRDPVGFLADLRPLLRRGGRLVVEVPNVEDALLSRYALPEFEAFYWHIAHSFYFSRATLGLAARRAGLRPRVLPVQRYPLSNHLQWAARRGPGDAAWLKGLLSPETESAYARDLCADFCCDTLLMVARR